MSLQAKQNHRFLQVPLVNPPLQNGPSCTLLMMGRPRSADKMFFKQEAPKIETQKCSTKRGVREPLHVEFALNNRELVKAEAFDKRVFEQTTPSEAPKPNPKSRNTKKHCVYTNFFKKFARTFAFFPVTRVRNPLEILQRNL